MNSENITHYEKENNTQLSKKSSLNFNKSIDDDVGNEISPISEKNNEKSNISSLDCIDIPATNTLPISSMQHLQNQFGGHSGLLKGRKGKYATIVKPLTTEREGIFYKKIKNTPLYQCLPKFFGMKKEMNNYYNDDNNTSDPNDKKFKVNYWLILQDLTNGMTSPCIADLKIGTRTCEIDVPQSKQEKRYNASKGTTILTHGVRCVDICIRQNNKIISRWNRKDGRKMSWADLTKTIEDFLSTRQNVVQFKEQLKLLRKKLIETYQIFPNLRLYSSSVLIVYDGDNVNGPLTLKLIDFGHGYIDLEAEGGDIHNEFYDDNAIFGIDNLLMFADSILNNTQ